MASSWSAVGLRARCPRAPNSHRARMRDRSDHFRARVPWSFIEPEPCPSRDGARDHPCRARTPGPLSARDTSACRTSSDRPLRCRRLRSRGRLDDGGPRTARSVAAITAGAPVARTLSWRNDAPAPPARTIKMSPKRSSGLKLSIRESARAREARCPRGGPPVRVTGGCAP